jgi:predicted DNA-binding WGR domain protein
MNVENSRQLPKGAFMPPGRPDIVPEKLVINRIRPEHNERRFYALEITRDIFGAILLSRNWGRIGTAGRERYDMYPDIDAAISAFRSLASSKQRRGYWDVASKLQ